MISAWKPPLVAPAEEATDVLVRHEGALGHITLNRPQAINALTTEMIRQLHVALDELQAHPSIEVVLIDGAGERGLCAGGDIIALQRSAIEGTDVARTFWAEEYALNARVARFPKPVVAIMDGIVMGGGIGLAGHASHRLATERLTAAMPEVGIGFAPDVGGTWLLSRAPGQLGTHVALTAGRVGAIDAVLIGLADQIVPRSSVPQLIDDLRTGDLDLAMTVLARAPAPAGLPEGTLAADRPWIDACYQGDSAEAIVAALDRRPEEEARAAAAAIRRASPTSVKVTLRALRQAARLTTLEAALEQELQISSGFLRSPDFVEGVRAQVIDKDRSPRWQPPRLEDVREGAVDAFFSPPATRDAPTPAPVAAHHVHGRTA